VPLRIESKEQEKKRGDNEEKKKEGLKPL